MKDLVKVRIVEATKGISIVTEQPMLTLKLELHEPILLNDKEVDYLLTVVPDGDNKEAKGWRQAQLRYVLGLDPYYQAGETLMTPEFTEAELRDILGKEFLAAVNVTELPEYGERLRVIDIYRLP